MTDKITLTDLANLQNETTAVNAINANNAVLVAALDNTLSRDGTSPNQMDASLDMNSNRILNLPTPLSENEPVRFIDIGNAIASSIGGAGSVNAGTVGQLAYYATPGQPHILSPLTTGVVLPSGTTATTQATSDSSDKVATDSYVTSLVTSYVAAKKDGVFNPRTQYGAVPDGSTDNSTAIAAAFAASNTFTSGIPTVYFDCDTSLTTCVYNYGGSGISPINPLVATTIMCAPGATLNYTGTAHAADIGPTTLTGTTIETKPYKIQGCRWTGGVNYTQGIFINNFLIMTEISENTFNNFGNRTGYNIRYGAGPGTSNNWEATIKGNFWYDNDGVTRNMVDAHLIQNGFTQITNNAIECLTPSGAACSTTTYGVGFWVHSASIMNNSIQFHYPNLRISSNISAGPTSVIGNHFEGNAGGPTPCITYGDPGGTAGNFGNGSVFASNSFFCPSSANQPMVGPETPASGDYSLNGTYWDNNSFGANFGWAPASYINVNSGGNNIIGFNRADSGNYISQTSTIPIIDRAAVQKFAMYSFPQNDALALAGKLATWDSTGSFLQQASVVQITSPLTCSNTTASGTAQICTTSPRFTPAGGDVTPVAGNIIIYTTNTANTGSLTLAVNALSAAPVKKTGGTASLSAGDIKAGVPYLLGFDGTNWNLVNA